MNKLSRWILVILTGVCILAAGYYLSLGRTYYAYLGLNRGYAENYVLEIDLKEGRITNKLDLSEKFDDLDTLEINRRTAKLYAAGDNGLLELDVEGGRFEAEPEFLVSNSIRYMKLSPEGKFMYTDKLDRSDDYNTLKINLESGEKIRKLESVIQHFYLFSKDGDDIFEMWAHGKSEDGELNWEAGKAKISLSKDKTLWVAEGIKELRDRNGYNPGFDISWPFMATDPNGNLGIYNRDTAEWKHSVGEVPSPRVVGPRQVIPEKNLVVLAQNCLKNEKRWGCIRLFNWKTLKVTDKFMLEPGDSTNVVVRRENQYERIKRFLNEWMEWFNSSVLP